MSHTKATLTRNARQLFGLSWTLLLNSLLLISLAISPLEFPAARRSRPDASGSDAPVALIKSIISSGTPEPSGDRRGHSQTSNQHHRAGPDGMFLYRGDQVITENAQSTLLFLDNVAEKNNEGRD